MDVFNVNVKIQIGVTDELFKLLSPVISKLNKQQVENEKPAEEGKKAKTENEKPAEEGKKAKTENEKPAKQEEEKPAEQTEEVTEEKPAEQAGEVAAEIKEKIKEALNSATLFKKKQIKTLEHNRLSSVLSCQKIHLT